MTDKKWYQPSTPDQIQPRPWLHPNVIRRLEEIIQPDWSVIEHGSGGSTLWLAERCKQVWAFERNPDWAREVRAQAPSNVYIFSEARWWKLEDTNFPSDLLLIDGEPVEDRREWIKAAPSLVKPGGWVVLDNANRPEYEAERDWLRGQAASVETFNGNEGGTLYLVTEFYRMKGGE